MNCETNNTERLFESNYRGMHCKRLVQRDRVPARRIYAERNLVLVSTIVCNTNVGAGEFDAFAFFTELSAKSDKLTF